MASASTAHESPSPNRESSSPSSNRESSNDSMEDQTEPINEFNDPAAGGQMSDEDQVVSKVIKFKFGDKFTKKPLQYENYLILLGRIHVQIFDLETFQTKILLSAGEDQAEKLGALLK